MFRHLIIKETNSISIKHNNLILKNKEESISIHLSEIASIVLETQFASITTHTLSKLNEYNIILYTCDDKHLINGYLLPLNSHCKSFSVLQAQINVKKVVCNNLWKIIIESKIKNQAECLKLIGYDSYNKLYNISSTVKSNDKDNREAYAARIYFDTLFKGHFTRRDDICINSALNYGYSIIRGSIARYCASYGLNTELGIFHCNQLNSFNLVDDLIEPFRPFVDLFVFSEMANITSFSTKEKRKLLEMNTFDILIENKHHTLDNALEIFVRSYKSSILENDPSLLSIPKIISLGKHKYE